MSEFVAENPIAAAPSPAAVSGRLRSLEAARGVAAICVVLMHASHLMRVPQFSGHIGLGGIFDFGYVGVDFFFVLSGFVITYVHFAELGQAASIPRYLWRRFSRVYPIYWCVLFLYIAAVVGGRWALGKDADLGLGVNDVFGTILLLKDFGLPKYVGVAWSLQYEITFYLMFCVLLVNARLGCLVFLAWGLTIVAAAVGIVSVRLPYDLGGAHCLQFLGGVAVGALARKRPLRASGFMLPMTIMFFVAATVFEVQGPFPPHSAAGRVVLGLAAMAVLMALIGLEQAQRIHAPAWLVSLGSVSYSVYLGHILCINLVFLALQKLGLYHALPEVFVYAIGFSSALLLTSLVGHRIELPLVRGLRHPEKLFSWRASR